MVATKREGWPTSITLGRTGSNLIGPEHLRCLNELREASKRMLKCMTSTPNRRIGNTDTAFARREKRDWVLMGRNGYHLRLAKNRV
jgi:hypothetical protein